ncbi:hypothetical protein WJX73_005016 [Symbiochloris irregularis]|uniref:Uncharacterized protein n=1 Tax=Symbiochloris irregularis TaxID=706552 RepID=A0AAW1PSM4_9CHLO
MWLPSADSPGSETPGVQQNHLATLDENSVCWQRRPKERERCQWLTGIRDLGTARAADRPAGELQGGRRDAWGHHGPSLQPGTAARPGTMQSIATKEAAHRDIDQRLQNMRLEVQESGKQLREQRHGRFGTAGRRIRILTNYFQVMCTLARADQWDVNIVLAPRNQGGAGAQPGLSGPPARPQRKGLRGAQRPLEADTCRIVMRTLHKTFGKPDEWFFDGRKVLFAPNRGGDMRMWGQHEEALPVHCCNADGMEKDFLVTLRYTTSVDMGRLYDFVSGQLTKEAPQSELQVLDIALKHGPSFKEHCLATPTALFMAGSAQKRLPHGIEVWLGHTQSLKACQGGLMLNVHPTPCAFWQAVPVEQFLMSACGPGALNPGSRMRSGKKLQGLKVRLEMETAAGKRVRGHKAKGLTTEGADQCMFMNEKEGRQMSVAEYYHMEYGVRLRQPHLPCVDVGSAKKPVYLPMELTHVARGQKQKLTLNDNTRAEMLKVATMAPQQHLESVRGALQASGVPLEARLGALGMRVSDRPMEVEARQLPPPRLQYGPVDPQTGANPRAQIEARDHRSRDPGKWNMNRSLQFFRPGILRAYAVVACVDPASVRGRLETFVDALMRKLAALGITVPQRQQPPIHYHQPNQPVGEELDRAVQSAHEHFGERPNLIFVLMKKSSALYAEVKKASDSYLGIPSQCMALESCRILTQPPSDQYCANLAMKINAKLGGVNAALADRPAWQQGTSFMVFGADVTHPKSFNKTEPSIAAVVGSLDNHVGSFATRVCVQGHRLEIIQNLRDMVLELLEAYHQQHNDVPARLLFFRDGVSEGELAAVQSKEIPQIFDACEAFSLKLYGQVMSPPLTFVVARKRHGTRMYPMPQDRQSADSGGNLFPGTVLDRVVTHPSEMDFFLLSQAGLKGTSRPTHYHVLLCQNQLTPDDIQSFAHQMCFLYCRCTRAVSMCPPAYYAHLAAARAKALLPPEDTFSDTHSVSSSTSATTVEFAPVHKALENTMYYI